MHGGRYVAKRRVLRALALATSVSRFFGGAVVSSEAMRPPAMEAISSTACWKAASLAFEGLVNPLILRTNWSEAARISGSVTGGAKLNRGRILRHMWTKVAERPGGAIETATAIFSNKVDIRISPSSTAEVKADLSFLNPPNPECPTQRL